ncbi:MAG: RNA methyltransferase [Cytophagales bacterium]|nr:RNA methyltransferase [Cytophagales bacterium]MDW8383530.1 RNA methyltransferase [Flammeovirgaceae bacterium]
MLSRALKKYVRSLGEKKYRNAYGCFLVEGLKNVGELLHSKNFEIQFICYTEKFSAIYPFLLSLSIEKYLCYADDLEEMGTLQTNDAALAVVKIPENSLLYPQENEWILALDNVRDPGNLGAIIRIADWYNIQKIVCSFSTVDCYNPKVIASSMGSFTRVKLYYCSLRQYLERLPMFPKWGAYTDEASIYDIKIPESGILIMGNESNGISPEVEEILDAKISIPRLGNAESLNVSVATAILIDNIVKKLRK